MASRSLFSILSNAPWWASVLVAAGLFFLVRAFLPDVVAIAAAAPFVAIGGYAGWRQLRTPSAAAISSTLEELRTMPWNRFSTAMAQAFQRQGYTVTNIMHDVIDFELRKDGRVTVVSCRRWKMAHTGVEPLRRLRDAMRGRDAHACIFVAAGSMSEQAGKFARDNLIRLIDETELGAMMRKISF